MRSHDYITQIQPTCKVGNATVYLLQVRSPNQELAHPIWLGESAGNYMVWFAGMVANDTGKSTDQD